MIKLLNEQIIWIKFQRWLLWAEIWLADAVNMGLMRAEQPLAFHSTLALFCLIECQFFCCFLEQEVHNYDFSGVFLACLSVRGGAFWSMMLQARNVGQIPPPTNPTPKHKVPRPSQTFPVAPKGLSTQATHRDRPHFVQSWAQYCRYCTKRKMNAWYGISSECERGERGRGGTKGGRSKRKGESQTQNIDRFPPKDWMDKHSFFPSIDLHEFW